MILLSAIFIGITLALVWGGKLRGLADLGVRHAWFPVALFAIQALLLKTPFREYGWALVLTPLVVVGTYAALVGWLLWNRTAPGILLVLAGASLNLVVIAANGGYMPVTPEALARSGHEDRVIVQDGRSYVAGSKDVVLEAEETVLWPLSDVLTIPSGLPLATNFSVGDVLIAVGVGRLAYAAVRRGAAETVEIRTGTSGESGRWVVGKEESDA